MSFALQEATQVKDSDRVRMIASAFKKTGRPVVLVPLKDGVHAGHSALIRAARALRSAVVIVAVSHSSDEVLDTLRRERVDVVWEYQPGNFQTRVVPENTGLEPADELATELTQILSLVGVVLPAHLILGEKDYELLVATNRALQDLNLPVRVQGVPTVRMPDGVALSLRNVDIEPQFRGQAQAISAALTAGAHAAENGAEAVLEVARAVLKAAEVTPEYLELRGVDMAPAPSQGDARLLLAATVGGVRLIDNAGLPLGIGFKNLEEYQATSHASRVTWED